MKERLEQLGRGQGISRVASGSPVDLILRPGPDLDRIRTIDATKALARRGMSMSDAKQAIEVMLDNGEVAVEVPTVEDLGVLADELRLAGVDVRRPAQARRASR